MSCRAILFSLVVFSAALSINYTKAVAGDSLTEALAKSKIYIDERYRFEHVDQDNFARDAEASTLRTRIGITTGHFYGFLITAEFENVTNVGNDLFNNTINGQTLFPVVADVESSEVNQLFLQYSGLPDTIVKVGRQVIALDNMRFVGHVGWRQNNQTFDAAVVKNTSIEGVSLTYGYVDRVNRIFGNQNPAGNFDSNSHLLNGVVKIPGLGALTGYAYLLDFEGDSPVNSSATIGGYLKGRQDLGWSNLIYRFEYAHQEDYEDNPTNYEADYYHLAVGLQKWGFTATAGYEVLGSDNGVIGFSTPLATGHIFNGYADQFLVTPANGLEDFYIDITYKVKGQQGTLALLNGLLLKAQYHDFGSEEGSIDFGTELDFFAKMPLKHGFYVEAKYADYNADSGNGLAPGRGGVDVEKFTFGLGWKRSFSR